MQSWLPYILYSLCAVLVSWVGTQIFRRLRWSPKTQLWVIMPGLVACGALSGLFRGQIVSTKLFDGLAWGFLLLLIASAYQRYDLRLFKN